MSEISLEEGRNLVARTLEIGPYPWTADEIRWIAGEWGIFRHELFLCRVLEEEIMEMELRNTPVWVLALRGLRSGARWWLVDSPALARMALALVALFAYAYGVGRF